MVIYLQIGERENKLAIDSCSFRTDRGDQPKTNRGRGSERSEAVDSRTKNEDDTSISRDVSAERRSREVGSS